MKVLVLGGTGLISTSIVRQLLKKGHKVAVVNRGKTPVRTRGAIDHIRADRSDLRKFEKTLRDVRCDAVIDMICFHVKQAQSAFRTFHGRVKHFVHCSTTATTGGPLNKLPSDESEPYKPSGDYGLHKMRVEKYYLKKSNEEGFPVTILRPAYTFGPGAPMINIWGPDPHLIDRLRRGQPVIIYGDGSMPFMATYIDDVAIGFVGVLGRRKTFGEIYNVASENSFPWREYIERIAGAIGGKANLVPIPTDVLLRAVPPEKRFFLAMFLRYPQSFSNEKLKRDISDFRPKTSFEAGVRRTVKWLDSVGLTPRSPKDHPDTVLARQITATYKKLKV